MPFKSTLAALLAFCSFSTFALDMADRDVQLKAALKTINSYGSTWTEKDGRALPYKLEAALVTIFGAAGAGIGGILYTKANEIYSEAAETQKFQTMLETHGPRVALGVLALLAFDKVVYEAIDSSNRHDAEQLRAASATNVDVYRAEMAHFLNLDMQEQFLIAKKNPQFGDDLITLAQSYEKSAK